MIMIADINKEVMKESSRALSVVMKKASERLSMVSPFFLFLNF